VRVVVVGGGVGGLAAAIRLRAAGHEVVVLERGAVAGGKLAVREREGFTFDVGPSLVTLPHVFDELLRCAGTSLAAEVDLVRLDPQFAYRWPDGRTLVVRDDGCDEPGYREFVAHGARIWEVAARTFFAGPMSGPVSLVRRMRSPRDLLAIDPLRTLHASAAGFFDDPHMRQWAGRYATYSGSSPFAAPATLACIPAIEAEFGCWYPRGGLGSLRDALVRVALGAGVVLRCGAEVTRLEIAGRGRSRRVTGATLGSGEVVAADVVVANVDAAQLYTDLVPDERAMRRVRRARPSTSGIVVLAGVEGSTPEVTHHGVWFGGDDRREFDDLAAGRLAADPTIYACVSSVTDPGQAPPGCENWFLLVNAPAGAAVDAEEAGATILDHLARRGVELRDRLRFSEVITPADLERRHRSPGGAIYGTSSDGRRAAFVRPANRGSVDGLYLAGGSSHPGGGLPLVVTSARIVTDMIDHDLRAGRARAGGRRR